MSKVPFFGNRLEANESYGGGDSIDLHECLITNRLATYMMRVEGQGLQSAGIQNNDVLIVDRSLDPSPGSVVIAIIDGDLHLRKFNDQSDFNAIWGVVTWSIKNQRL